MTTGHECVICNKVIKKGQEENISCQELDFCHGRECDCGLVVGKGCYRKFRKEHPKEVSQ